MRPGNWWRSPKVVVPVVAVLVVVVGAVAALVTSSSGPDHTAGASGTTVPVTTAPPPPPTCPLTGAPPPGGSVPNRPAIAVKVDNYPDARPQSGLDNADVVFEEPVEGGVTRLVAVFQCQDDTLVGPIRSAREPDVAILDELSRPIFVHVGGIDPVLALINGANARNVDLNIDGSLVQHVPGRYAPYDTYVSPRALWDKFSSDTTPPSPIFRYDSAPPSGSKVTSAHIPFSDTSDNTWTWSPSTGSWLLSVGGRTAALAGGGQVSAANVVVMTVQTFAGPWAENELGAYEVEVNPVSGGPVIVLRNGVAVTGTWSRSSVSTPARLTTSDGSPISLAPGETWVELVPSAIPVTTVPSAVTPTSAGTSGSSHRPSG